MADEKVKMVDGVPCKPIAVGGNEKATPIKLSHTTMRSLAEQGPQGIRMAALLSGQDERRYLPTAKTGADADMALATAPQTSSRMASSTKVDTLFARGETVWDAEFQKKVVIMKRAVAYTEKGTPIHKVASKGGKVWCQRENKLRKL